jgi:hypothetical protein
VRSEVPGIIEASVTIAPKPDGLVSFRVRIGAGNHPAAECDLIELIVSLEHVGDALAEARTGPRASGPDDEELPVFPCHIGLYRNAANVSS